MEIVSENTSDFIQLLMENSWIDAFPLAQSLQPLWSECFNRDDDDKLARDFCPIISVDSKLFIEEREVLARNLGLNPRIQSLIGLLEGILYKNPKKVADSIFNFCSGVWTIPLTDPLKPFPDSIGAQLWLLSRIDEFHEEIQLKLHELDKKSHQYTEFESKQLELLKELDHRLSDLRLVSHDSPYSTTSHISDRFEEIFPYFDSPTCTIKYNVVRPSKDSNFRCIQYFVYWPIQLLPHHFFDYEPVYIYIKKTREGEWEILFAAFNGVPGVASTIESFFTLFRKRPGHVIRYFFNWDLEDKDDFFWAYPDMYNELADFMTKIYGKKYVYEKIPEKRSQSHIRKLLLSSKKRITLSVPSFFGLPVSWHAFGCPSRDDLETNLQPELELSRLVNHDLLHIEWNINRPFEAPFLYPLIGGKNPRFHVPFQIQDLVDIASRQSQWDEFCREGFHYGNNLADKKIKVANIFRIGHLIEFLSNYKKESPKVALDLWQRILEYYDPDFIDFKKERTLIFESKES